MRLTIVSSLSQCSSLPTNGTKYVATIGTRHGSPHVMYKNVIQKVHIKCDLDFNATINN